MDYDLVCLLARAYYDSGQEQKAKDLLLTVREEDEKDGVWNSHIGYSCFHLNEYEEALAYLEHAKELDSLLLNELIPQCMVALNLN